MPWVVDMNYENGVALYPEDLPEWAKAFVIHDITSGNTTCLLNINKPSGFNIPGAAWVEDFTPINTPAPPHSGLQGVPPQAKVLFKKSLKDILNILEDAEVFRVLYENYRDVPLEELEQDEILSLFLQLKEKMDSFSNINIL